MNFKFYQLYRSLKEVAGIDVANKIFPENNSLPDKMSAEEQAKFAKVLMERLDKELDKETVLEIRMKHPCGIPKEYKTKMSEIKEKHSEAEERLTEFSKYLGGRCEKLTDSEYIFIWGLTDCVC
jgi:hypothetical protein